MLHSACRSVIAQNETSGNFFTDAILVEDKIYFLATAEDTTSTYDDGEILGSIIGRMDSKTFKIRIRPKNFRHPKIRRIDTLQKNRNRNPILDLRRQ